MQLWLWNYIVCACRLELPKDSLPITLYMQQCVMIFRHIHIVRKSACYLQHVRLSVCMYQISSHWTDLHQNSYWRLLWKSIWKVQIWLKWDKNIWHFVWWPKYFCVVCSSRKCFVAQQQCKGNPCLHSHDNTEQIYIVDGNVRQYKGNMLLNFCGNAISIFLLLTVTWSSTVHVVFPWQQWYVNML